MDGDDTPCALDAELLEKCRGNDGLSADESVRVEQSAADDAARNDADSATDRLREESDDCTAGHGAEVGHDLCHGDLGLGETQLVLEHGGIQILTSVGHEVEAGHKEDQVGQKKPVLADGNLALTDEDGADTVIDGFGFGANALALAVRVGLGEHESCDDEEDGWAGAEPVQRAPGVGGCVDEAAGKGGGEEVAKGVLDNIGKWIENDEEDIKKNLHLVGEYRT